MQSRLQVALFPVLFLVGMATAGAQEPARQPTPEMAVTPAGAPSGSTLEATPVPTYSSPSTVTHLEQTEVQEPSKWGLVGLLGLLGLFGLRKREGEVTVVDRTTTRPPTPPPPSAPRR